MEKLSNERKAELLKEAEYQGGGMMSLEGTDMLALLEELQVSTKWIQGKPKESGFYWIVQFGQGGSLFGPSVAYIYDGYPDDDQPPAVMTGTEFNEWSKKHKEIGKFLRIRTVQGFGAGDRELRAYTIDFHLPVVFPEFVWPK